VARISPASIERVRDAVDFVEVVSAYTELRRAGVRMLGLCPFHDERTPSFSVDPREKLYYCFGCEAHGDMFRFVQEKQGLGFVEAVEMLADRYGIELEREAEDPKIEAARKKEARLGELLDRTARFFANALWVSDEAAKAREYLAGRGLGEPVLRKFGVGYSPKAWNTIVKRGRLAGYTDEELFDAGLVQRSRKGDGVYDRFRGRIVFPIRDGRGRTRGFGGRTLDPEEKAKYINSPESPMYHKKEMLFGLDHARTAIIKSRRAILVEGYTDVLACHQAGFENVVAISGTAFTREQARELSAMCDELVLALDADPAGRGAMLQSQQHLPAQKRLRIRVARIPGGKDPAEILAGARPGSDIAAEFGKLVDEAVDLVDFHVEVLLDAADLETPSGRDRALDEIVPVLATLGDSIQRDDLIARVADRLDADPALVSRRLSGSRPGQQAGQPSRPANRQPVVAMNRAEQLEFGILALCVAAPSEGRDFLGRLDDALLSSPMSRRLRDWLIDHLDDPLAGAPRDDEAFHSALTSLVMRAGGEPATREAMSMNLLALQEAALARQVAEAVAAGRPDPDLQRRLGELRDRIQHMR